MVVKMVVRLGDSSHWERSARVVNGSGDDAKDERPSELLL